MKIPKLQSKHIIIICALALVGIIIYLAIGANTYKKISAQEYKELVKTATSIKDAYVLDENLYININGRKYMLLASDKVLNASKNIALESKVSQSYAEYLLVFAMVGFLGFVVLNSIYQKRQANEAKLSAKAPQSAQIRIHHTPTQVKFDDIAGLDEVKKELVRLCDMIQNPSKYRHVRLPKGVLLCGPSGVGKTYIAKALASESGAKFFYHSAASFNELYIGVGAKKIRELFAIAKSNAPSIIFIDEIDAIGKARGSLHANESESTLNELLTQMDGFVGNDNVIVIAATNQYDTLDSALTRSGRFDKKIFLSLPDFDARVRLYELYCGDRLDIRYLARLSEGFSGADIATFANEFALLCIERCDASLDDAIGILNKIKFGHQSPPTLDERELLIQSVYQSSKAYMAYMLGYEFERAGLWEIAYTSSDKAICSRSDITAQIKILLAGKVANEVFFDDEFDNCTKDHKKILALLQKLSKMGIDDMDINELISDVKIYIQSQKQSISALANILRTRDISLQDIKDIFA